MTETLKVAMLGLSGCGKTTYLASMFRKLSVQSQDIGFYLEGDNDQQRRDLNNFYRLLLIPDQRIPKTQVAARIRKWPFTFRVRNGFNTFPALKIEYADYAGEFLNMPNVNTDEFINYLKEADVVLGMISGLKIYQYLKGSMVHELDDEITNTIHLLDRYAHGHPAHIVVTMWDLFENTNENLQKVKDTLNNFPLFQAFVDRMHKAGSPIRLIPVSSYGFGFVEFKDNDMHKIPGAIPNPFQMETPLACTFKDSFTQKLANAQQKLENAYKLPKPQVREKLSFWDFIRDLGDSIAKTGLRALREILPNSFNNISDTYLKAAIENIEKSERRRKIFREEEMKAEYERLLLEQARYLDAVKDENTAYESALRSCDKIILRLEKEYRSSLL